MQNSDKQKKPKVKTTSIISFLWFRLNFKGIRSTGIFSEIELNDFRFGRKGFKSTLLVWIEFNGPTQ
jgi:hypothetical protein